MSNDTLSAALDEIRGLIGERDKLIDRMRTASVDIREFNAAQDRLAEKTPTLLTALDEVLALHTPDERSPDCCKGCREECLYCESEHEWPCVTVQAISRALLGEEAPMT